MTRPRSREGAISALRAALPTEGGANESRYDEDAGHLRGTNGSNPAPSSGESGANLSLAGIQHSIASASSTRSRRPSTDRRDSSASSSQSRLPKHLRAADGPTDVRYHPGAPRTGANNL